MVERFLDTEEVDGSSPFGPTIIRHSFAAMPVVYILKSRSTGKFYVGSAMDGPSRYAEHHRGQSPYTRSRGPWDLAYEEQHLTLADARRRERQIKSWKSHRSIQELIDGSV